MSAYPSTTAPTTSQPGRVLVVGAYNAALTLTGGPIPRPGQTVLCTNATWEPGGKAANQAAGISRLGVDVSLLCRVGDDFLGTQGAAVLRAEGLPTDGILVTVGETGIAIVVVDGEGENAITVAPGVNSRLSIKDVETFICGRPLPDFVVAQLECGADLAVDLARWSASVGRPFVLNPAPALPLPELIYGLVHVLTPNEHEVAELAAALGAPPGAPPAECAALLVERGAEHVVVTLGADGALWVNSSGRRHFPTLQVKALDSTGAGDAFTAALVASLARGLAIPVAIENACRAGAFCVTQPGVFPGLGRWAQIGTQT